MGAWSAGLFGDDLASDVRDSYLELLRSGVDADEASRKLLSEYRRELADKERGHLVWLALAATQWQYGRLQPDVKTKALQVLRSGRDLKNWEDSPPSLRGQRRRVLDMLRRQLESTQPRERTVRTPRVEPPSPNLIPPWKPGQLIVFRRASGKKVLLLTDHVDQEKRFGPVPCFALLHWEGKKVPTPAEIRKLPVLRPALKVIPYRNEIPPVDRMERLEGVRKPAGLIWVSEGISYGSRRWTDWKEIEEVLDEMLAAGPRK